VSRKMKLRPKWVTKQTNGRSTEPAVRRYCLQRAGRGNAWQD
jgi:hypothetical protein